MNDDDLKKWARSAATLAEGEGAVQEAAPLGAPTIDRSLLGLVRDELRVLADEVVETIGHQQFAGSAGTTLIDVEMQEIDDRLEKISKASEVIGLLGLQHVLDFLRANLSEFVEESFVLTDDDANLIKATPLLALHYLEALDDREICAALVQHLQYPFWRQSLPPGEAQHLINLLAGPSLTDTQELGKSKVVTPDLSLTVPENVNQELLDSLLHELPLLTAKLNSILHRLTGNGDLNDIRDAQRIAHTLKGSANIVGIAGIANLSHSMEDIFEELMNRDRLPHDRLGSALVRAGDCLEAMIEAIVGAGQAPADAQVILQEMLDWAGTVISEDGSDVEIRKPQDTCLTGVATETSGDQTTINTPGIIGGSLLRVSSKQVDNLLWLGNENTLINSQMQENVRRLIEHSFEMRERRQRVNSLISRLDDLVITGGLGVTEGLGSVKSGIDLLEMDQYNELHDLATMLIEVVDDTKDLDGEIERKIKRLNELLFTQERLHEENQEAVLQTRLIPVQQIISRCRRVVRQTARTTEKLVELEVSGTETLVDSETLYQLVDPLMHLLRNAVDHGIEPVGRRQSRGKNPVGRITLEFSRQNRDLKVVCQDDGSGLNYGQIRQTAEEMGIATPGDDLPEYALDQLIMTPGFTTRGTTTQVSGRGIGLDAVRSQVLAMNGTLDLTSDSGQGCRFELLFPSSLVSVQSVLILCGDQIMAISSRSIKQILYIGEGNVEETASGTIFQLDGAAYRAVNLGRLLNMPVRETVHYQRRSALLTWENDGESTLLLVEKVLENKQLVVKGLGKYVPKIQGIVGAAILGDGSLAPVLDVGDLLKNEREQPFHTHECPAVSRLPTALVVDDSLAARRSLSQLLCDTGFEVRTAINGVEAIAQIEEEKPDILFVDLEMPRMSGLELTVHVRQTEETRNVPVIMITSRPGEKYKNKAREAGVNSYLTKPYSEDDLLDRVNAVIGKVGGELQVMN